MCVCVSLRGESAGGLNLVPMNSPSLAASITPPQGFLPTLLEDVPDMAVKFAVYESMRTVYAQVFGREVGRTECPAQPSQAKCPAKPSCLTRVIPQRGRNNLSSLSFHDPPPSCSSPHCCLPACLQPSPIEDLLMGGSAGAAAAAATTPLDVVKTRMMCSASQVGRDAERGSYDREGWAGQVMQFD